jgi:hypothetical protein
MGIEAILALAGLVVPPVTDFVKKKFLKKGEDTTEATISSLATTKPDIIPSFIEANTSWLKAKIEWFNRDLQGEVYPWVHSVRALIRPVSVIASILIVALDTKINLSLDAGTRGALLMNISSWFSDRIK